MERIPTMGSAPERDVDPERLEDIARLKEYVSEASKELSEQLDSYQSEVAPDERVTVAKDLRIEPPANKYLERDRAFVEKVTEQNYGTTDEAVVATAEEQKEGFQFELLKSAIMHKFGGSRFISLRSSRYDDIANHVDNVLVDRITGEPICAVDEVASGTITKNERFDEKVQKVVWSNLGMKNTDSREQTSREKEQDRFGPGARLKYGIRIRNNALEMGAMNNLPLFLLPIDRKHLAEGLKNFGTPEGDKYSQDLYQYFLATMVSQIGRMEKYKDEYAKLPIEMRQRMYFLQDFAKEEIAKLTGNETPSPRGRR